MTAIYVLRNPQTKQIVYVGRTRSPNMRLRQHLTSWRRAPLSQRPFMEIVQEVSNSEAAEAEASWAQRYREQGHMLINRLPKGLPKPNSDKPITTTLPDEILRRLDRQHDLTHVPKKKLIEQALDEFLPVLKEKNR